jgi:hypothetical protein
MLLDDLHKLMVLPEAVQVLLALSFVFLVMFPYGRPQLALDGGIPVPQERGIAGLVIPDKPILRTAL